MYWNCKGLGVIVKLYEQLIRKENFKLHLAGASTSKKLKIVFMKYHHKICQYGWVNNIHKFFEKIDILIIPSLYDSSPNLLFEVYKQKINFCNKYKCTQRNS